MQSEFQYNGGVYRGDAVEGVPNGDGTCIWADGRKYVGKWKNGRLHGKGAKHYPDGTVQKGTFVNGIYVGKVDIETSTGQHIEVEDIEDSYKHRVRIIFNDTVYRGQWYNGRKNGYGVLTEGGKTLSGFFLDGRYIGQVYGTDEFGRYLDKDHNPILIDFSEAKYHGNVHIEYFNGSRYDGEWENGVRHGKGRYVYSNGDVYDGYWDHNERSGSRSTYMCSGCYTYRGDFNNDMIDGYGTVVFNNGTIFEGTFHKGMREGEGRLKISSDNDGRTIIGKGRWKHNLPDGIMRYELSKTESINCEYKEGKMTKCTVEAEGNQFIYDIRRGSLVTSGQVKFDYYSKIIRELIDKNIIEGVRGIKQIDKNIAKDILDKRNVPMFNIEKNFENVFRGVESLNPYEESRILRESSYLFWD